MEIKTMGHKYIWSEPTSNRNQFQFVPIDFDLPHILDLWTLHCNNPWSNDHQILWFNNHDNQLVLNVLPSLPVSDVLNVLHKSFVTEDFNPPPRLSIALRGNDGEAPVSTLECNSSPHDFYNIRMFLSTISEKSWRRLLLIRCKHSLLSFKSLFSFTKKSFLPSISLFSRSSSSSIITCRSLSSLQEASNSLLHFAFCCNIAPITGIEVMHLSSLYLFSFLFFS